MYDLLTKDPPVALQVGGEMLPVNYSFRNCIKIIQAFETSELTDEEKWAICMTRLFGFIPDEHQEAADQARFFLDCGDSVRKSAHGRTYSFTKDSRYIRSAFEKTFRMDLKSQDMHWWEFCYKFLDLDENCFFTQIVAMRARFNKRKPTKEDKAFKKENPELFDLSGVENRNRKIDAKEKEAELIAFMGGEGK